MSIEPISSYESADGDKWDLGRDLGSGRIYVLHRPGAVSGGTMVDYELDAFVERYRASPQHDELMRLAKLHGEEVLHA